MGDAFGDRSIGPAGIAAVEILPVHGAEVHRPPEKRRHVRHVNHNHRAEKRRRMDFAAQFLKRQNRRIFISVIAGDEGEREAGLVALNRRHGNSGSGIRGGGNFDESGSDGHASLSPYPRMRVKCPRKNVGTRG